MRLNDSLVPILNGEVQCVEAVGVTLAHAGSVADEDFDHLQVALPGRQVEGCDLEGGRVWWSCDSLYMSILPE